MERRRHVHVRGDVHAKSGGEKAGALRRVELFALPQKDRTWRSNKVNEMLLETCRAHLCLSMALVDDALRLGEALIHHKLVLAH